MSKSRHEVLKLMYTALIDIRYEANEKDMKKIYSLSDLFHNTPLKIDQDNPDFDKILEDIIERSKANKNLEKWVELNLGKL